MRVWVVLEYCTGGCYYVVAVKSTAELAESFRDEYGAGMTSDIHDPEPLMISCWEIDGDEVENG